MRRILWERLRRPDGATLATLFVVLVWASLALPFALGERTLILRDVFATHLPLKWFGAQELAHGRIPAMNPTWALGQPFAGNPNALPYYPGNLLYLLLPFWVAFNLHYFLHWLLAFFTMRALGRALGMAPIAAVVAGTAYAGSGYLFSCMNFYNLLTVAAWMPLVLAGLVRGGRRGALVGGLAGGMVLLGGEPITAALATPLALYCLLRGRSWRAALPLAGATVGLALLVAAPQLVAAAEVLPSTYRAAHGLDLRQVTTNPIPAARLVELLVPLPWGTPAPPPYAHWAQKLFPFPPFIISMHLGVVALLLILFGAGRARAWMALTAGSLAAGWALGLSAPVTAALTLGVFRYPQKMILPFTLAACVVAGFGMERLAERRGRGMRWFAAGALALGLAAALLVAFRTSFAAWLGTRFAVHPLPGVPDVQTRVWIAALFVGAALLALAAWAAARGRLAWLPVLQLAGLLPLVGLIPSDTLRFYDRPPRFATESDPRYGLVSLVSIFPWWELRPEYPVKYQGVIDRMRLDYDVVEPGFAIAAGFEVPLAPDIDSLTQPLQVFLSHNLARADWPARVRWLRRLGVGALVREGVGNPTGLEVVDRDAHGGVPATLLAVPDSRGFAFRPRAVRTADSPREAYIAVARGELADDEVVSSRRVTQGEQGKVRLVSATPDRVELEVEGDGGLVGVRRAWQPLWRADLEDGTSLPTAVVDLVLLGVEVPPGRHRVRLWIPSTRRDMALAVGIASSLGALAALWATARRERPAA